MLLKNISSLPQIVHNYLGKTTFEPGETKAADISPIEGVLEPVIFNIKDRSQNIRIPERILC